MTDKELKKLSRIEMMELLLEQSRRIDKLQQELKEAEERFNNRELLIDESGSIAEAALKLNRIFEDAQTASEEYMKGLKAYFLKKTGADKSIIQEYESQISLSKSGEKPDNNIKLNVG